MRATGRVTFRSGRACSVSRRLACAASVGLPQSSPREISVTARYAGNAGYSSSGPRRASPSPLPAEPGSRSGSKAALASTPASMTLWARPSAAMPRTTSPTAHQAGHEVDERLRSTHATTSRRGDGVVTHASPPNDRNLLARKLVRGGSWRRRRSRGPGPVPPAVGRRTSGRACFRVRATARNTSPALAPGEDDLDRCSRPRGDDVDCGAPTGTRLQLHRPRPLAPRRSVTGIGGSTGCGPRPSALGAEHQPTRQGTHSSTAGCCRDRDARHSAPLRLRPPARPWPRTPRRPGRAATNVVHCHSFP